MPDSSRPLTSAPIVGIIPVRSFRLGMERLAADLTSDQRCRLGRALAGHVAGVVAEAGALPILVTNDTEVADWAARSGLAALPDPGTGLNDACLEGVAWAEFSGTRWVVIHSDLPLLRATDVGLLLTTIARGEDVIAPSADGGTSAISSSGRIVFGFGEGSFRRHLPRLASPTVVARPGLLFDLDSSADLHAAVRHPQGQWLGAHA